MNEPIDQRDWRWLRCAILIFAIAAPIFTIAYIGRDVFIALAPLFISHVALLYPTLNPHSQWWGPVIRSFATTRKEVWLTIDDGPSAQTFELLDLLDRANAKATFFVIGERAQSHLETLAEIERRGHQLANHTYAHPSAYFWCSPAATIAREVLRCAKLLPTTGPRFFRAPVGIKNFLLHPLLTRNGMHCIGWTVRGFDTVFRDPQKVARRIAARALPGAILVLHDRESNFHVRCLSAALNQLTDAGYRCVVPDARDLRVAPPPNE